MPAYKDAAKNTWYVKFRYTDWQGNRKETTKRGFATKREARDYEEEYKRKVQGASDMTLCSLYEIYMEDRRQKIKESSIISIELSMKKHVLPSLGQMSILEITPNVIRKWQNELSKATFRGNLLRPPTIMNINRRFAAILNFGVKYYGLPRNPMQIAGTQGKSEKRLDFWSKEEFDQFLGSVGSQLYTALFMLLFYSGMRVGEALALTEDDIDFKTGKVTISKTFTRQSSVTSPKTHSSNRVITIPTHVLSAVREAHRNLSYHDERIFPFMYHTVLYHFKKAIEKSGVRMLNIHSLRHAHASLLIEKGAPITAISKRLGHTSPQITLSIYAHSTADADESIANMLEDF